MKLLLLTVVAISFVFCREHPL